MTATRKAVEAVWRIESSRLIGGLLRLVGDLARAEDLAADALVAALERWPADGVPARPGAWLMTVAKNRARDQLRRRKLHERAEEELRYRARDPSPEDLDAALDDEVGDDVLRLMLIACHPLLAREARVALTLRLLGGLSTEEIARAFLTKSATIGQRISRAKRSLAEARVPVEVPRGAELSARLPSVLEVVYLIFNEGYAATRGENWLRLELCEEALRLGRILAGLAPEEAEVHGLCALLELHQSRARARTDASGAPILLLEQDRGRWDRLLIRRGLAALGRAESLARPLGPYTLQAAISACHARAATPEATDWKRIVALYDALVEATGSPVVALNRAVAVSFAFGPEEALPLVDELDVVLDGYHLLPAVRGDLLDKLGRRAEARAAFERAASLTKNAREQEVLRGRARACG